MTSKLETRLAHVQAVQDVGPWTAVAIVESRDAAVSYAAEARGYARAVDEIAAYLHAMIDTCEDWDGLLDLPADVESKFGGKTDA
jgi:hypothetical protein